MSQMQEQTSVFTDDSGARARRLQWGARIAIAVFGIAVLLLGASLTATVPLPGLDSPRPLPGTERSSHQQGRPSGSPTSDVGTPASRASRPSVPRDRAAGEAAPAAAAVDPGTSATTGAGAGSSSGASSGSGSGSASGPVSGPTSGPITGPTSGPTRTKGPSARSTAAPRAVPTKSAGGRPSTPPGRAK